MLEVEAKFAVKDQEAVRAGLNRKGVRMGRRQQERDVYYNAPHRDFGETDEALRVRYDDAGFTVTYKGPKVRVGNAKAREEFNLTVASGETLEVILSRLGFRRAATVSKVREFYEIGDVTVTLDDVEGLGTFVEIEILTEDDKEDAADRITAIAKELGVDGPPIYTSYLEMLLSKQR
ncbi:class IV adenylate cyclase [Methanoculleus sp. YWC-01]|jgi:adenylate cyclase class 2|uniref:Class IV adenylate cyclase n=1 Tax=Methanoculleus nereidis TaxID=2735141 RepID=A0ABU3Z4F7_9EURY|nr:class IV adenylate cyclase [Methanoculleus sp. YWC-01]MCK9299575.1 class IV adenylate cyclase [Methanoculleus sp.]MDV4343702.1 class IV adenylate cyclase [Methanoculleus sp. YWC-01]